MKKKYFALIGISLLSLTACELTPGPDYGLDFATPEFFLARLNSERTRVTISSINFSYEDTNGEIRQKIFALDSFVEIETFKPTTKNHFTYYSEFFDRSNGYKNISMSVYEDGNIKINYKEPRYKSISFYHSIEEKDAKYIYEFVKTKIETAKNSK